MHVESFHNHVKTDILERMKNTRVDTLLKVLRTLELHYFWKWSRVNAGLELNTDPVWRVMHGNTDPRRVQKLDKTIPPDSYFQSRRSEAQEIFAKWEEIDRYFSNTDRVQELSVPRKKNDSFSSQVHQSDIFYR